MLLIPEKLKEIGIDPIVPLPMCEEATGMKSQALKSHARRHPDELEIIRVSERRCGIRSSVLKRFIDSRKSALSTVKRSLPPQLAEAVAKRAKRAKREVANV